MRLTIFQKGVILVALPLAAQAVFVTALAWLHERTEAAQAILLHTREVISTGRRLEARLAEAQSGARGYVLTGNQAFVGDLDQLAEATRRDADHLIDLVADNPPQQERARRIAVRAGQTIAFQFDITAATGPRPPTGFGRAGGRSLSTPYGPHSTNSWPTNSASTRPGWTTWGGSGGPRPGRS